MFIGTKSAQKQHQRSAVLKHWLRTRKRLLARIKKQVKLRLGPEPKDLRQYGSAYKEEFKGHWRTSTHHQLQKAIAESDIVLGADFHAFIQAQKTHLRILREFPEGRKVVLALECFESQHNKWLNDYLNQRLNESDFLNKIQWEEKWGFPWEHYKPLLQLATARGFVVAGINRYFPERTAEVLHKRDIHSAERIAKLKNQYPDHLIYVIYGDLHVAYPHLPKKIEQQFERHPRITLIYQNSENLYFRLARRQLEASVEVVKAGENKFCVIGSPPWVKWQSYLMYLEHTYDQDLDDEDEGVDYTDHVSALITVICNDLGVSVKGDDLAVYTSQQSNLWGVLSQYLDRRALKTANYFIENERSFYLPQWGIMYLSRATMNHAAGLAGQYVHAKLCGRTCPLWNMPEDFVRLIWAEAVGFFASQLVNHKRKAESVRDLKAQLAVIHPRDGGREALLLALDQRMAEMVLAVRGRPRKRGIFQPRRRASYFEAARILGSMTGERLYTAYREGRIPTQAMLEYLGMDVESENFQEFYYFLVKRLEAPPGSAQ